MQKPMNPSKEKKHMKQMSIPLGSPAIAPARSLVAALTAAEPEMAAQTPPAARPRASGR